MSRAQTASLISMPVKSLNISSASTLLRNAMLPLLGILIFLSLWAVLAKNIDTSLGSFPGPSEVFTQAQVLIEEHGAQREKANAFYERQEQRNAARIAQDPSYNPTIRAFTGAPTFFDQIWTSLYLSLIHI